MKNKASIIHKASFNPRVKSYILWSGIIFCVATIVGVLFIPVWLLITVFYVNKYYERLECELTTRSLRFKKGYIFHTEKTIPLDKIQDLTFKEGPLLKFFGLSVLKVETAGSSGQGTADLSLIGIMNAAEFRQMVLDQRDIVTEPHSSSSTSSQSAESTQVILTEIRDSLLRIEEKMK